MQKLDGMLFIRFCRLYRAHFGGQSLVFQTCCSGDIGDIQLELEIDVLELDVGEARDCTAGKAQ